MESNRITFTVTPPPATITGNTISAPKTSLTVGEAVTVNGELTFPKPLPSPLQVEVKVYVNNTVTQTFTVTAPSGASETSYSFELTFNREGTYTVYTYVTPATR